MSRKNMVCPIGGAWGLDNVFRKIVHNPNKILKDYVKEGMTVLDVGCGPGFFSIEAANIVGKQGRVIAADLQEGMLEKVKKKINENNKDIISLHKCGKNRIGVKEKVDFVLVFYMLHEVPDQKTFLEEILSILRPRCKVLIIEPIFHVSKKDFEESKRLASSLGFKILKTKNVFLSRSLLLYHA